MSESADPSMDPASSPRPSKTWQGPLPWLLMSLPALGGILVVLISVLGPHHHPAYRELENRLGFWGEHPRALLSQLYIAHALRSGLVPRQIPVCSRQIASGDDLSLCAPERPEAAEASARLMGDLADFVLQNTPPRGFSEDEDRAPAEERSGGFYFGDSPGERDQSEAGSDSGTGRVYNPDAI